MLFLLIVKLLGLVEYALDYLIKVDIQFTKDTTGAEGYQWALTNIYVQPTAKGYAILDDVWTIAHQVMDFVAQFTTLLPAASGVSVNNIYGFHVPA